MIKYIVICYAITLHIVLLLVFVKTDLLPRVGARLGIIARTKPEITQHYVETSPFLERIDQNVPDGTVIFIGDSIIQGLCVSAVTCPSVNYGIGTDTTTGVLLRVPKYRSLQRARACVLSIGGNDLRLKGNDDIIRNYSKLLQEFPLGLPRVVCAILPVDERVRVDFQGRNNRTHELNKSLKILCLENGSQCTFIDPGPDLTDSTGNLKNQYHIGDGLHLNGSGYTVLIQKIIEALPESSKTKTSP